MCVFLYRSFCCDETCLRQQQFSPVCSDLTVPLSVYVCVDMLASIPLVRPFTIAHNSLAHRKLHLAQASGRGAKRTQAFPFARDRAAPRVRELTRIAMHPAGGGGVAHIVRAWAIPSTNRPGGLLPVKVLRARSTKPFPPRHRPMPLQPACINRSGGECTGVSGGPTKNPLLGLPNNFCVKGTAQQKKTPKG